MSVLAYLNRIVTDDLCYYVERLNRNTDCDYSSAYVSLYTDSNLVGHGMTFTIGRGNDIVSFAFVSTSM
jgi:hypothetical protein